MKKVLIITYYWPPSGGAGVQRVLKTVKYLRAFGWEPVVYTAKDAAYPVLDDSLAKDVPAGVAVIRGDIWEPYELYKKFTGQKKDSRVYSGFMTEGQKPSLAQRASVWLRGNLFIPDARAMWWRPSVRFLNEWLKTNEVDAILSSGPPHTTHLIARDLKRKNGLPWLADFRDPWTDIDFYDQLMLTGRADRRHRALEQSVLREADRVTTVSWHWAKAFEPLGHPDVGVITNGFDADDFDGETADDPDATFSICHIGSLNKDRNSESLWRTLAKLAAEDPVFRADLRLRFIGKVEAITFHQLAELGLEDRVERTDYLPHAEITAALARARVLLLLTNDTPNVLGIMPGKLYEYMAARRPILAVGVTAGDSARVLRETGAGVMCHFGDEAAMEAALRRLYADFRTGQPPKGGDEKEIARFTRRGATERFAEVLNEITSRQDVISGGE